MRTRTLPVCKLTHSHMLFAIQKQTCVVCIANQLVKLTTYAHTSAKSRANQSQSNIMFYIKSYCLAVIRNTKIAYGIAIRNALNFFDQCISKSA